MDLEGAGAAGGWLALPPIGVGEQSGVCPDDERGCEPINVGGAHQERGQPEGGAAGGYPWVSPLVGMVCWLQWAS